MNNKKTSSCIIKTILLFLSFIAITALTAISAHSASTIEISPDPVENFNVVNLESTSKEQIITINNTGTSPLNVNSMNISGSNSTEFFLDPGRGTNPCNSTSSVISPGASCTVCVVLSPTSEGSKNALLTIESNASNQPSFNLNLIGNGSQQEEFSDVMESHWAENYVNTLYYNGITTGCGNGNYCPSSNVSRAQMATFIIRALYGDTFSYSSTPYFTDVPDTHWAFMYIQKMYEDGITSGCGGTNYCPSSNVSRAQMATFIIRALYGDTFSYSGTPYFTDVPDTPEDV
jgi:hypothetical protein